MAESGPADRGAALLANALAGNPAGTAARGDDDARPAADGAAAGRRRLRRHRRHARGRRRARRLADAPPRRRCAAARARARIAARAPTSRWPAGIECGPLLGSAQHRHPRAGRPRRCRPATCSARPPRRRRSRGYEARPASARPRPADPPAARAAGRSRRRWPRSAPAPSRSASATASACASTGRRVPGGEILSESPPLGALQITPARRPDHPARRPAADGGLHQAGRRAPGRLGRVAQLRPAIPCRSRPLPAPGHGWYLDLDVAARPAGTRGRRRSRRRQRPQHRAGHAPGAPRVDDEALERVR